MLSKLLTVLLFLATAGEAAAGVEHVGVREQQADSASASPLPPNIASVSAAQAQDSLAAQFARRLEAQGLSVELRGPRATVHSTPADSLRADQLLDFLHQLPPLPGLDPSFPAGVAVYLTPDREVFNALTGGGVPDWGAGVAFPDADRIVMPAVPAVGGIDNLQTLRHEWAHIALHQQMRGLRIPRWFDEGYAQWASGGWNASEAWKLRTAMILRRTPPLDSLRLEWPRERGEAEIAYMLSATAVEYVTNQGGAAGLERFFARWREQSNFDVAFGATFGTVGARFEELWRRYVRRQYGWLMVFSDALLGWTFLSVLLLGMVWTRRGRNQEGMARLRAKDGPDLEDPWMAEVTDPSPNASRANAPPSSPPPTEWQ